MGHARSMAAGGVLLIGGLSACSSEAATGVHAAPPAQRAGAKSARLFVAPFKTSGLKGWSGAKSAWHVDGSGVVTFDGPGSSGLFAPFRTKQLRDFAISASIEAVGQSLQQESGYGVEIRGAWPGHGIVGGSFFSADATLNEPQLLWGNDSVGGAQVTLQPGYNTYRVEVHGTDYALFINGQPITRFTVKDFSGGTKVGLWGLNQKVQVKAFTVTRLSKARPLAALPPLKRIALSGADVPAALTPHMGHFFTNNEMVRLNAVAPTTVTSAGNVLAYRTAFGTATRPDAGAESIYSLLSAYRDTTQAQTALAHDWEGLQKQSSGNTNFRMADVPGLGDEGHVLSYDYFAGSYDATVVTVVFRRGAYEETVTETFVQGGNLTLADFVGQVTTLAKAVDGRIQLG